MRIDVNTAALSQLSADQNATKVRSDATGVSTAASAAAAQTSAAAHSDDTATFSSDAVTRSSLASKALQSPPIRQDKVDVLAQALHGGQYELSPASIGTAIVADRAR